MDKSTLILGISIGIVIGFVVSGFILIYGVSEIANSLHIQIQSVVVNNTVSIPLNETRMIEAINHNVSRNP